MSDGEVMRVEDKENKTRTDAPPRVLSYKRPSKAKWLWHHLSVLILIMYLFDSVPLRTIINMLESWCKPVT